MASVLHLLVSLIVPLVLAPAGAEAPADFKMTVDLSTVQKNAVSATSVIVVRKGIAYQFLSSDRDEVQVIDPAGPTLTLIHLKRRVQTEIGPAVLESNTERLRSAILTAAEKRAKSEDRGDRLSAAMSRDLADPKFQTVYDAPQRRLLLTNPTVEIGAVGEPDADTRRLAVIGSCLTALAKLGALRDPAGLPPFPHLEALRALVSERRLMPGEITILYRLAGPPRRLRWTYHIIPELTDSEREAISRIDSLRATARYVRYPVYEPDTP